MTLPERVAVLGGGRMGTGIAHLFLAHGAEVQLVEADDDRHPQVLDFLRRSLDKASASGALDATTAEVMTRLELRKSPDASSQVELVVEAVPEDLALKSEVLNRTHKAWPGAWLATNTSSLSINAMAVALKAPEALIGLHFFNPVPTSDLLEIVIGEATAPLLVDEAAQWAKALNKTAITVRDTPGFASSRLGVALALEAIRMVEQGVASAEDIDTAMTLGYRHPTGPLRTTDIVGLDVRLAIAEHLASTLGAHFEPPALLRDMVAAGKVGRKSGQGFFRW